MTTPTLTCDSCEDPIEFDKDPKCLFYEPSGATQVMCIGCREAAYDRWQERSLEDWPISITEQLRQAYRIKRGWQA